MSSYTLSVPDHEELTLHIRKPMHNTNGSILLLSSQGGVWDCDQCRESDAEHFTEKYWVEKFDSLFRIDNEKERKRMREYNKNKENFEYKRSDHVKTADQCRLSREPTVDERIIAHFVWNPEEETIELQLSETTEPAKDVMGSIKYTNIVLRFTSVSASRPAKRQCV